MKERMARSVHDWVDSAPSDRASLDALLRRSLANMPQEAAETQGAAAFVLTDTAREGLAWLEELGHQ